MNSKARIIQRRAMGSWVKRESIQVSLKRTTRVSDGAGGKRKTGEKTLAPQTFRIAATARQHDMNATSTSGEIQGADWLLIGAPNADIQTNDIFETADGRWWRVKFVDQRKNWRTGAGVVEHGV